MIVFESRKVRRIIGRFERGERLPESLRTLAAARQVSTGWFTALGAFEWVELVEYDQARKVYKETRRYERECEILSLVGNVSFKDGAPFVHLHACLSRDTDNGIEVIGGHLIDASVFACEFHLDCHDDLGLGRQRDDDTGLFLWAGMPLDAGPMAAPRVPSERPSAEGSMRTTAERLVREQQAAKVEEREPARESRPPSTKGGTPSWADVAAASERRLDDVRRRTATMPSATSDPLPTPDPIPDRRKTSEEEFFEEPIPEKGDWVDHKQFGICRVEGEDAEGALIIRMPSGVRKSIRLDVLTVLSARIEGDRRIYPLIPRKR